MYSIYFFITCVVFAESREIRLAALDAKSNENLAFWSEKFVHP